MANGEMAGCPRFPGELRTADTSPHLDHWRPGILWTVLPTSAGNPKLANMKNGTFHCSEKLPDDVDRLTSLTKVRILVPRSIPDLFKPLDLGVTMGDGDYGEFQLSLFQSWKLLCGA